MTAAAAKASIHRRATEIKRRLVVEGSEAGRHIGRLAGTSADLMSAFSTFRDIPPALTHVRYRG